MGKFITLWIRELRGYFLSPVGYVVLCCFLFISGLNFWFAVSILNRQPTEITVAEAFFNTVPFWLGCLLMFPLITMRTFAEEFRMGTIEPLMTAPVTDLQVVLAKYFGALAFYVILWLPSLLYFQVFSLVTNMPTVHTPQAMAGSYLLVFLVGMLYLSVGCLASALTNNQIVAAVLALAGDLFLILTGLVTFIMLNVTPLFRDLIGYFSTIEHMMDFSRGVIDTRPVVFYLSGTALMLVLTFQVFQYRKWRV
jgi:ABC-2 type transport system permease protein